MAQISFKFRLFCIVVFLFKCQQSVSLETNPPQQFSIFSVPSEEKFVTNNVEDEEISPQQDAKSFNQNHPQLDVEIQIHDVNGDGTTEGASDNTITPFNSAGLTPSRISPRGRSGVVSGNNWKISERETQQYPITWDEAYGQSVKRAVVRSQPGNGVAHHRNIVRLQPIVPKSPSPPPHEEVAKMARFIVHTSNWTSMATISTRSPTTGFPFANILSVSDGPVLNSSGSPYLYMTPLDVSAIDLTENTKSSLTMSLAQGDYCKSHGFDPEDPRCARVILTGSIIKLKNSTREANLAKEALFSRHPNMQSWPKDHGWFFAKLEIADILVLDYFGGAKSVTPEEYFAAEI